MFMFMEKAAAEPTRVAATYSFIFKYIANIFLLISWLLKDSYR
jgi:hypothetical protein